jgi:hypothetical protein
MVMWTTPDDAMAPEAMLPFKGNGTNVLSKKSKRRRNTHFIVTTQLYSCRPQSTTNRIGERMDSVCLEVVEFEQEALSVTLGVTI